MKKYAGEEFLNKIYRDLFKSDEVQFSARGGNKNEDVSLYMDRLNRVTNKAIDHGHLNWLKKLYYDKYVIKPEDVPESYFELQKKRALYDGVEFTEEERKKEIAGIISDQKDSLDVWIDYFASDEASIYPTWFKFFCFQGMVRLGQFNKEKGTFSKRTASTVKPFIELNAEAIAFIYEELVKVLDKHELNDSEIEKILKNGSFSRVYAYIIQKLDSLKKDKTKNEGVKWKKYKKGSDHHELVRDLKNKGSGWCISMPYEASVYLKTTDMHIGYTQDDNGLYSIPRIAFNVEDGCVKEIRGILGLEQLELEMIDATGKKMAEFSDKGEFPKALDDLKRLSYLVNKKAKGEDFSEEELKFLYEVEGPIISFGLDKDPRIEELKKGRDNSKDLKRIINYENVKSESFDGDLIIKSSDIETIKDVKFPRIVKGNFEVSIKGVESDYEIQLPEKVYGNTTVTIESHINKLKIPKTSESIYIDGLDNIDVLEMQEEINKDLYIWDKEITKEKKLAEVVKRDLKCTSLTSVKNFKFPKKVFGDLYTPSLEYAENVVLPEEIYGNTDMFSEMLKIVKKVEFPKKMNNPLNVESLEVAEDVIFPENSSDSFNNLKILKNTSFLEKSGSLDFGRLKEAENVEFSEYFNGDISMSKLDIAKNVTFPKVLDGSLYLGLEYGDNAVNMKLPEEVKKLYMEKLVSLGDIQLPKKMSCLSLMGLTDFKDLDLSNTELKDLELDKVKSLDGVKLPKSLDFISLSSLETVGDSIIPDGLDCEVWCFAFDDDLNKLREASKKSGRHM